jgi:hypothetical protein
MDFRDKKGHKSKKSKFEEEEAKHKRMEKRLAQEKKSKSKSKKGSELTTGLLAGSDRSGHEPRSFFEDSTNTSEAAYNYRNSESTSIVSSSINGDPMKSAEPAVPEDYAWDFVVVLPVGLPEQVEGEEQVLPALEPSEVRGGVP